MRRIVQILILTFVMGLSLGAEGNRVETTIAKGYGKVSLVLPQGWTVTRYDQGFESTDSTFYVVSKHPLEDNGEIQAGEWAPGFLLCFEKEVKEPNVESHKYRPLVGEPRYGTLESGLQYCRVERLGTLLANGPAVIDQRSVTYHFSGLPHNLAAKISGPKELLAGDALTQLEDILKTLIVKPTSSAEITEAEVNALYAKWQTHMWAQEWEDALPCLVKLLEFADPPKTYAFVGRDDSNRNFYDLGVILMGLERWTEAKYCFKRYLVWINSDTELERLFGEDFSRSKWLTENDYKDQRFFKEFADFLW